MTKRTSQADYQAKRRAAETPEQREKRLAKMRAYNNRTRKPKGAGPGRSPLSKEEPTVKTSITLTQSQLDTLAEIGDSVSDGVRTLVEDYLRRKKRKR